MRVYACSNCKQHCVCNCVTYQLRRGSVGASGMAATSGHNQPLLPLWGQVCYKLMAEPDCVTQPRITGFINIQVEWSTHPLSSRKIDPSINCMSFLLRMVGGLPDWIRLWCVMCQHHLHCWTYPEDVGRRMPIHSLDLTDRGAGFFSVHLSIPSHTLR